LFINSNSITAKEIDGYIITKNGSKLQGEIQVSYFNYNGSLTIDNINYLRMYTSIYFKESGAKRFTEYFADDIDGFSFVHKEGEIFFFSIELTYKSWGKPKYRKKFLRLLINGQLILYDFKSLILFGNNYSEHTNYYISDRSDRILNVSDNNYQSFEEYLFRELKIEKEFLRNQTCKINIKNLREIIYNYNQWKSKTNVHSD